MKRTLAVAGLTAAAGLVGVLAACGGDETSTGSGNSGAATTSGSGGAGGQQGGQSPTGGSTASGGTTATGGSGGEGNAPPCPPSDPVPGTLCQHHQQLCSYDDPNCDRVYECVSSSWRYVATACEPFACGSGGLTCETTELCVKRADDPNGSSYTYECGTNPCGEHFIECDCANDLCGGSPYVCDAISVRQVTCACPLCS